MRRNYLLAVVLLTAGMAAGEAYAQNVVVRKKDGSESINPLSSVQKITFSGGNLVVNLTGGSSESYSISTVGKLYFGTGSTGTETISLGGNSGALSVYPNPAEDYITLRNIPETTSVVSVYRFDGVIMLQEQVSPGTQTIGISNLPNGLYILNAGNQAIKFLKQ